MKGRQLIALAVLATGCTLTNAPDRSLLSDGGIDSRVDSDTGVDGDADVIDATDDADACVTGIEDCEDGIDNNCDSFVDCADPYCASRAICCTGGTMGSVDWNTDQLLNVWDSLPDGSPNNPELNDDGEITGFSNVQGVITKACVPLATGYQIRWFFRMESESCSGADECYASLVLTPATTIGPDTRLPNDLAVTAHGDGRVTITNATTLLGQTEIRHMQALNFIVDITVGNVGGESWLLATVRLQTSETPLVEAEPIAPLVSLMRNDGCENAGGLRLAIEGAGRQFAVGPLNRGGRECINASAFMRPTTSNDALTATSDSLRWATWAEGGIGSPGIAVSDGSGVSDPDNWFVVGDGTDFERRLDGAGIELGYAIGFARATEDLWNGTWAIASEDDPKVGSCYPSCADLPPLGMCGDMCAGGLDTSYRDPSFEQISVEQDDDDDVTVAYAARVGVDSYGIVVDDGFSVDVGTGVMPEDFVLQPGVVGSPTAPCMSLRDPMLVRRNRNDPADGYWLFYSCYAALDDAEIHAIQLDAGFDPIDGTHKVVVAKTEEDWAASSVWSPEVIVEYEPGTDATGRHLFRLWFLARNRDSNQVGVGLVQGQLDAETMAANRLPDFVPFGANPILVESDPVLSCGMGCDLDLRGLAVVRELGTPVLRFLVAREGDTDPEWQFLPLEQRWASPWD